MLLARAPKPWPTTSVAIWATAGVTTPGRSGLFDDRRPLQRRDGPAAARAAGPNQPGQSDATRSWSQSSPDLPPENCRCPLAGRPAPGDKAAETLPCADLRWRHAGSRQYSRSIEGPSGMGERTTPRWLRRTEGAPRVVDAVWAGPPEISQENRAGLLAAFRRSVNEAGFELRTVRRGCRRRVIAEGKRALDLLRRQEGRADANAEALAGRARRSVGRGGRMAIGFDIR